jgi:two-component system LytT family sensor kinase
MAESRRPSSALLLAIATGFGLSSTLQAYWLHRLTPAAPGPHVEFLLALNLIYWYVPALVAPSIMRFALGARLRGAAWSVQTLVHAAGALGYALLHTAIMLAAKALMLQAAGRPPAIATWWAFAFRELLVQLDWLLMTYLFLVGLAHALAYRQESEEAAVNTARLETRLVEARLQALQRQLHPHFLFNTLNTISGLVRTDPGAADTMLDRLGDLLRMTLRTSGTQSVRLQDELEVLQKYIDIEQTRFGDRLAVTLAVDPAVLDARVPNLLLQPLVENAIRHGIAPKARPGRVMVRAAQREGRLVIEVRDSGDGAPPERLTALNLGVGLENTRARLEHLYRSDYRLEFANHESGFCVTIGLPLQADASGTGDLRQIA